MCHARFSLRTLLAVLLLCLIPWASFAQELAVTYGFTPNGDGIPIQATTTFNHTLWDAPGFDLLTIATHELYHAIGFTVNYPLFANHLYVTPGAGMPPIPAGSRVFSTDGTVGGIRLVLTPFVPEVIDLGTHADNNATGAAPWPATGYNQANDIMQPFIDAGDVRALSAQDRMVLDSAFNWSGTGINITINFFDDTFLGDSPEEIAERNAVFGAVAAVEALFGKAPNPNFTWNVNEVPEPLTWILFVMGLGLLVVVRSRFKVAVLSGFVRL